MWHGSAQARALFIHSSTASRKTCLHCLRFGEITAGMLAGNLVVFPKLFSTYYPKLTRFGTGAALSWKSRLTRRHTDSSASWAKENDTSNMMQDYAKLSDSTRGPTNFPSNGGGGPHPVVTTSFSGYNPEHDSSWSDDGTNMHNGILKTVRMDQGVQYG